MTETATWEYSIAIGNDAIVTPSCLTCGASRMVMIGKTDHPLSGWITECPECNK